MKLSIQSTLPKHRTTTSRISKSRPTTIRATYSPYSPGGAAAYNSPIQSQSSIPRDAYQGQNYSTPRNALPGMANNGSDVFTTMEGMLKDTFQGGASTGWKEIEGAYVRFPKNSQPKAVVHFIGGALVGAAPQITYNLLLEALAAHGCIVIATGYSTGFDNLRISDECHFKYERAMRAIGSYAVGLPVFGVGHSLGALAHLLICARYPLMPRAGNILISYNNRPATDSIPLLSQLIAPSAAILSPVLRVLQQSPVRAPIELIIEQMRNISPGPIKQFIPLLEQVQLLYLDLAAGRREYIPAPEETRRLIRQYYTIPRNMMIRFRNDSLDETADLSSMLSNSSTVSSYLDMSVKVMGGDHLRPLAQTPVAMPRQVAQLGSQSAELVGRLAAMAGEAGVPQELTYEVSKLSASVADALSDTARGSAASRSPWAGNLEELAGEMATWMGIHHRTTPYWSELGRNMTRAALPPALSNTTSSTPSAGNLAVYQSSTTQMRNF